MGHIFVSYKHEEAYFAELLKYKIKEANFNPWMDDQLRAGEDWRGEIDQAIKNSLALIVILTPEAIESKYITYEWAFALGANVKVIPVVFKRTPLHPRLEALQWLDFTNHVSPPWDKLIEVLRKTARSKRKVDDVRENTLDKHNSSPNHYIKNPSPFQSTEKAVPTFSDSNKEYHKEYLKDMLVSGKVQVGDRVYTAKRPDLVATIIDGNTVEFQGRRLPINSWGMMVTGWSAISIYNSVFLERTRKPLGVLRENMEMEL